MRLRRRPPLRLHRLRLHLYGLLGALLVICSRGGVDLRLLTEQADCSVGTYRGEERFRRRKPRLVARGRVRPARARRAALLAWRARGGRQPGRAC
jgi:hypothetical protein